MERRDKSFFNFFKKFLNARHERGVPAGARSMPRAPFRRSNQCAGFANPQLIRGRSLKKTGKQGRRMTLDARFQGGDGEPLWTPSSHFRCCFRRPAGNFLVRGIREFRSGEGAETSTRVARALPDPQSGERYYLKAINCAHHHKLYAANRADCFKRLSGRGSAAKLAECSSRKRIPGFASAGVNAVERFKYCASSRHSRLPLR